MAHMFVTIEQAVNNGNVVELKKILKNCKQVGVEHGFPLHAAVKKNRSDMVKALLNHDRIDVNCLNREGYTSLFLTCDLPNPDLKIATDILAHGANPNISNYIDVSPLHLACKREKLELVKLLIRHQADVNSRDSGGYTPLHYAIKLDAPAIARYLLAHNAYVDGTQVGGFNALMLTLQHGYAHVALLLEHRPNPDAVTCDGRSVLWFAITASNRSVVRALLERGASLTAHTGKHSPLAAAVMTRDYELFELIWQHMDLSTVTETENFMRLVCRHCPLPRCYKRYALILNTPGVDVRVDGASGLLCRMLRAPSGLEQEATKQQMLNVIGWLLDRGVRLGTKDVRQTLWCFRRCPYTVELWQMIFAKTAPNITYSTVVTTTRYGHFDLALLFGTYCLHLGPEVTFLRRVPETFWRNWLALFTLTGQYRQKITNRSYWSIGDSAIQILNGTRQIKSLVETARDAVRQAMRGSCKTTQDFLIALESLGIPTYLEDIIRLRIPVNRHLLEDY